MKIPDYKGYPLSLLARISTDGADIPLYIWSPVTETRINTPEAIDSLVADGYALVPQDGNRSHISHLFTQLFDVQQTATEEKKDFQIWAHPDSLKYVRKNPVTLAYSYDKLPIRSHYMPMVQPLPFPYIGEYGLVDNGTDKPDLYNIAQLPQAAQERWQNLQQAILALAEPGEWVPFGDVYKGDHSQYSKNMEKQKLGIASAEEETQIKEYASALDVAYQQMKALRQSWEKPGWLDQWEAITHMAQAIAADYYTFHLALKKAGEKPIPNIPDAFNVGTAGMAEIWTHQPFQAYPDAVIARANEWQQEQAEKENEVILSFTRKKPSGTTFVQIREEVASGQTHDLVYARMREQAERLSDLDADVYLAMLAQLCMGTKDEQGFAWIRADKILDYRGLTPKKNKGDPENKFTGGHRWEKIEEVAACIKRMENMFIKVQEQEIINPNSIPGAKRRRGSKTTISRESRLFVFGDVIRHNTLPLDGSPGKSIPIAWQYQESSWMLPFMQAPNRFVGLIFQKVLNYDPHNEKWEKRLSRYLTFWLRMNARHEKKPDLIIGNLLKELNLDEDMDEERPQRVRDRFDKAMDTLQRDGILTWDYDSEVKLPARKWLSTWMAQKITVEDPPVLKSQYMSIAVNAKIVRSQRVTKSSKTTKKPPQS